MGLVNLPILNRTGFSNNWNVSYLNKFYETNITFFFLLIKSFFLLVFKDCFFFILKKTKKKKDALFFKNNICSGQIFLLFFSKWLICYFSFFKLKNKFKSFFFIKNFKTNKLFFRWKKSLNLNYKILF